MRKTRIILPTLLLIHCCLVLNAQRELQMERRASNKVNITLNKVDSSTYQGNFALLGIKTDSALLLSYDEGIVNLSSVNYPNNAKEGEVRFSNRLPVVIKVVLLSDQTREVPIVFTSKINDKEVVVFNGFWKNPKPKGLNVEALNSPEPVEIQESEVKEGKFKLSVKYKLTNESDEEILLQPTLSSKQGKEIRIAAGGEREYEGTVTVTRPGSVTTGQKQVRFKFQNVKYSGIAYEAPRVDITWEIVKPESVFDFPFDWVFLGLLLIILALLVLLLLKARKKSGGDGGLVAGLPDDFQKDLDTSFNKVNEDTKGLSDVLGEVNEKVGDLSKLVGIESIIESKIEENNRGLIGGFIAKLETNKLIKTDEDFERQEVLDELNAKLDIDDFRLAPEALAEVIETSGGQKVEEVLWQRSLNHFKGLFEQLGGALGSNPYYASSRVTSEDFEQLAKIDMIAGNLAEEKQLKLVTQILRITSWKVNGVQFKDEALTKFFHEINMQSELLSYARFLLLDALYLMRYELIIPDIFVDSYTNPDDFMEAPAAPVMQGKWKPLAKELGISQHCVYDLFAVGVRKEGKVVQKPIVSRIP